MPDRSRLPEHHKHQRSGNAAPFWFWVLPNAERLRACQNPIHTARRTRRPCAMVGSSKRAATEEKTPNIWPHNRPEIMPGGFSLPSQNATERPQSHESRQGYKHTTDTQNTPQKAKTSHREPRPKTTERPTTSSHAARMGLCSFIFRLIGWNSRKTPIQPFLLNSDNRFFLKKHLKNAFCKH